MAASSNPFRSMSSSTSSKVPAHILEATKRKKIEQESKANKNLSNLAYYTQLTSRYDPSKTAEPLSDELTISLNAEIIEKMSNSTMDWSNYNPETGGAINPLRRCSEHAFDRLSRNSKTILSRFNDDMNIIFRKYRNEPQTFCDSTMELALFLSQKISAICRNSHYIPNRVEEFRHPAYQDIVFHAHPFYVSDVPSVKMYLIIVEDSVLIDYFFNFIE